MPYQRVGNLVTIAGHGSAYFEYWYNSGRYNCHPYMGPNFAQAEIFNDYPDVGNQLMANNQGVLTRSTCRDPNTFTDIDLYYTVGITNSDGGATRFFLNVGRF